MGRAPGCAAGDRTAAEDVGLPFEPAREVAENEQKVQSEQDQAGAALRDPDRCRIPGRERAAQTRYQMMVDRAVDQREDADRAQEEKAEVE